MAAREHRRQEELGEPHGRLHVQAQDREVRLDGDLPPFPALAVAGVVHEDLDLDAVALEFVEDFLRGPRLLQVLGDHARRDAVVRLELRGGGAQLGLDRRHDDQRVTMPSEFMGEMQTDAGRSAGNESGLVVHTPAKTSEARAAARLVTCPDGFIRPFPVGASIPLIMSASNSSPKASSSDAAASENIQVSVPTQKAAGAATGAVIGGIVAGPIGAVVGGVVGALVPASGAKKTKSPAAAKKAAPTKTAASSAKRGGAKSSGAKGASVAKSAGATVKKAGRAVAAAAKTAGRGAAKAGKGVASAARSAGRGIAKGAKKAGRAVSSVAKKATPAKATTKKATAKAAPKRAATPAKRSPAPKASKAAKAPTRGASGKSPVASRGGKKSR